MLEENSTAIAHRLSDLLDQELHLIRYYRHLLPEFSESPFVSLLATMLEDHEKSARDLRLHLDDSAKSFDSRFDRPFKIEFPRALAMDQSIDCLTEEEDRSLRYCKNILDDMRSPEGLRQCIRDLLIPRLENHIAVLGIMTS